MNMLTKHGTEALTEKEKQTLRLMVRGHDAKSIARSLDLSVHTINERLREARRKMAVSSSREAARLLLSAEGNDMGAPNPNLLGDAEIGEDARGARMNEEAAPIGGVGRAYRPSRFIIGGLLMTFVFGLLAIAALPQLASTTSQAPVAAEARSSSEVVATARQWLALLDQGRWDETYQATGTSFRQQNSKQVWAAASEEARVPLGAMISRTFVSQENLPAPPAGYEVVKFRTRFANKTEAVETVTLDREDGSWRVVGVTIG